MRMFPKEAPFVISLLLGRGVSFPSLTLCGPGPSFPVVCTSRDPLLEAPTGARSGPLLVNWKGDCRKYTVRAAMLHFEMCLKVSGWKIFTIEYAPPIDIHTAGQTGQPPHPLSYKGLKKLRTPAYLNVCHTVTKLISRSLPKEK